MIRVESTADASILPAVLDILHLAFAAQDGRVDPPSSVARETIETLTTKLEAETLLIARDDDGTPVGCIFFKRLSEDEGYIGRLAVHPDHQRQGIAHSLIEASIEAAREAGVGRLGLDTRIELTQNHALFRRHGFEVTSEHRHPGYDRTTYLHMERAL
ncbi:MAG: GNAT family N-acetyltransferase [Dehalococcoidia bacterium]